MIDIEFSPSFDERLKDLERGDIEISGIEILLNEAGSDADKLAQIRNAAKAGIQGAVDSLSEDVDFEFVGGGNRHVSECVRSLTYWPSSSYYKPLANQFLQN